MTTDEFRQIRDQASAVRLEREAKLDAKDAERTKRFEVLWSGWANALDVAFQDSGSDAFGIGKGDTEKTFDPTTKSGTFAYRRSGPNSGFSVEIEANVAYEELPSGRDALVGEDQNNLESTASMGVTLTDNGTRQVARGTYAYTMQPLAHNGHGNAFVSADSFLHFLKQLIREAE